MLTPDDLVNYPLKLTVRGYSVAQVDDLLDRAADALDRLQRQVDELTERLGASEERLAATSETEDTLKRTLVTAQRAAEQALEEARERAASIVEEAERDARAEVEGAREEATELREAAVRAAEEEAAAAERRRRELEERVAALRTFEEEYRGQIRAALEQLLRQLGSVGRGGPARPAAGPERSAPPPPSDVADLLEPTPPRGPDEDRAPLTVRVHRDERDGGDDVGTGSADDEDPHEGGTEGDAPLASEAPSTPESTPESTAAAWEPQDRESSAGSSTEGWSR